MKRAEGFTNGTEFWFIRLVFNSAEGMKKYKYYLENNEINITAVFELLKPVKFKLGKITAFTTNGEYDVIKIDVNSPALHKLNKLLKTDDETRACR